MREFLDRTAVSNVWAYNSPSLQYLKGRGLSERIIRGLRIDDVVLGGWNWMAVPMRGSDTPFSETGFIDVHLTRLEQVAGTWRRSEHSDPYWRMADVLGTHKGNGRAQNAVAGWGAHWGSATMFSSQTPATFLLFEGIETMLGQVSLPFHHRMGSLHPCTHLGRWRI